MRLTGLAGPGLASAAFVVLLGAVAPGAPGSGSVRSFVDASSPGGGNGGGGAGLLATLGPLLLVALVVLVVVAAIAAFILFRTRGTTTVTTSEGWWTCPKCGAGNMDGAARCHACSTWRTTTPGPTPSTSP
jgi:hypothetical protein